MKIYDVILKRIDRRSGVLTLVKETDPLLRRFGQLDLVTLGPDSSLEIFRNEADEIWTVVEGNAHFNLIDNRENSPSFQNKEELGLGADPTELILIPFGVQCLITSTHPTGSTLVRLTTHEDGTNPGDSTLS